MRWIRLCSAVLATVGLAGSAHAGGLFGGHGCGSGKSCGCASECQPTCCRPRIQVPCEPNVYTYQRQQSCAKPACCSTGPAPKCCAPKSCGSKGLFGCLNKKSCGTKCQSTACCQPACTTTCAPACTTTCAPACTTSCAPACNTCSSGSCGQKKGCGLFSGCSKKSCSSGCQTSCCEVKTCCADPCEIARLIYESQTACYAKDRRKAVDALGDDYDCQCNPEIMSALIYALNDADERVRAEAAAEIGDQLEKNSCCCSPEVIAALSCALGDCDCKVVKNAKGALELCGYDVVEPCGGSGCSKKCCFFSCKKGGCKSGCSTGCAPACTTGCATGGCANGACATGVGAPAVHGAPAEGAAPAPAVDVPPTAPSDAPAPPSVTPAPPATAAPAVPAGVLPAAPAAPSDGQAFQPGTRYYTQPMPVQRAKSKTLANLLGLAN